MSAPSSELARVREILRARGYLAPPGSSGTRGFWPRLAGWSLLLAATCTLVAVSAGGGAAASLLLFTLAAWPTVAVLVFLATRLGTAAAARLLAWGARPEQAALAMGALAAVGVALAVAGCTGGGDPRPPGWLGLGAGLLLALHVFRASRRELLTTLHLEEHCRTPGPWGAAAVVVAGALALAWPSSGKPQLPWAPLSGLVPKTRVAVLAVDGLSREELAAGAHLLGGGVEVLARLPWARVEGADRQLPAEFWTTVACGAGPREHGVAVMEETRPFGLAYGAALAPWGRVLLAGPWQWVGLMPRLAKPSLQRRLPTFWEMASRAGYPVTVGGWWGTWPVRLFAGQVVSERAMLAGATTQDAVSPPLASLVEESFARPEPLPLRVTLLGEAIAKRAARRPGPQLLAVAFPGLDLEARGAAQPPLALAARQLPHLAILGRVVEGLLEGGFQVLVVGAGWQGGTWFFASSKLAAAANPTLPPETVAPLVLAALELPAAPYHRFPPGVGNAPLGAPRTDYGPPPPPASLPDREAARLQRELLESLGYVQ